MFKYFPHSKKDIESMLEVIGINSLDDLFKEVPDQIIKNSYINLDKPLSEYELIENMEHISNKNYALEVYAGAGAYDHYTPAIIPALVERGEFLTSYTPYQPEISQGTLQYIFEYQTMITRLTGLDVSNASLYDGATATAEAVLMAASQTRKNKVLISTTVDPKTIEVIKTYCKNQNIEIVFINHKNGQTNLEEVKKETDYAGLVLQNPNTYGIIEEYSGYSEVVHNNKALLIMKNDPSTLAVIKSPAELGADIAVGDGQSLGIPLSFGGPYIGYMATTKKLMRKMPGRIVGKTLDKDSKRGFVLTLQAREQHIRRCRATSNICSNQSLMALWVTIYLSLMGEDGLLKVNELSYTNAHYLKEKLLETNQFEEVFSNYSFIKEFPLKPKFDYQKVAKKMAKKGYLFGVKENGVVLFSATETKSKEKIDQMVEVFKDAL